MNARTIIPRTRNVQRIGLDKDLVRVTDVSLYANQACTGGPLHEAHGVRVKDGGRVFWFVSHEDAQRFGWVA